ncbi:MAG: hypothetical protein LAP40_10635 [Acidobacteriia bacterium]|nr:hypothetical protein [Terriglobia bacterium]
MRSAHGASVLLLTLAIAAGTLAPQPARLPPLFLGGYQVLSADFHVHTFPLNWTTLAPWDIALEAQKHGLDAIAIAGHNHLWVSQAGRWISRAIGGPTVLVSEEVVSPDPKYHLIAVGISTTVSWKQTAAQAIADVHGQGGVAIAAHPEASFWPAYDAAAMRDLDAAEVLHPDAYSSKRKYRQMQEFFARKPLTAIGSSDFHAFQYPGYCRTLIFVRQNTESGILEALRQGHTVVVDRDGRSYGDPALIRLAAQNGRLPLPDPAASGPGWLGGLSRILGIAGLLFALVFGRAATR